MRWTQAGFRAELARADPPRQRNLFGFKDGTNNIEFNDHKALSKYVWTASTSEPAWMRGGTYMVARRIRMLFDVWDSTTLGEQERVFGRRKRSGVALGTEKETDFVNLKPGQSPAIPDDAHIRQASHQNHSGIQLLRRSYSFNDGALEDSAELDAGLFFICFQRDPREQFIPIQRRLATNDALSRHIVHTATATFACPPGAQRGEIIGEQLLA